MYDKQTMKEYQKIYWANKTPEERKEITKHSNKLKIVRRKAQKIKAVNLFGGKCKTCGYNNCIEALEFHHRDGKTKEVQIYRLLEGSWKKLLQELEKCTLLCANCHREKRYKGE